MNEIYNEDYRKTITRIEKIPNVIIAGGVGSFERS